MRIPHAPEVKGDARDGLGQPEIGVAEVVKLRATVRICPSAPIDETKFDVFQAVEAKPDEAVINRGCRVVTAYVPNVGGSSSGD